jgi:membrane protein involved in colicin uptake
MPEGRRYGPDNPSPANAAFAQYIRDQGHEITDKQVQLTSIYHREWQAGHAEQTRQDRKVINAEKEKEREAKAEKREQDRKDRAEKKKADEEAKEKRRQEREDAKKAKEEKEAAAAEGADDSGADGDDSDSAIDGEAASPRRRLRVKGEPAEAGASAGQF